MGPPIARLPRYKRSDFVGDATVVRANLCSHVYTDVIAVRDPELGEKTNRWEPCHFP